jgi:hypothetical protein
VVTPYLTDMEKKNKVIQENRKKWLHEKGFNCYIGKATISKPKLIPNYVGQTPSQVPVLHKFREVNRKRWVGSKNFQVV